MALGWPQDISEQALVASRCLWRGSGGSEMSPRVPKVSPHVPRVSSCVPKVVPRWPWWSPGGPSGPKVAPGHLRAVPCGLKVFLTCPW